MWGLLLPKKPLTLHDTRCLLSKLSTCGAAAAAAAGAAAAAVQHLHMAGAQCHTSKDLHLNRAAAAAA
jgi:hypothetical protein